MPKPDTENRHGQEPGREIRTSTLMEIRKRADRAIQTADRLDGLRQGYNILRMSLDQHRAGYKHVNAAVVYQAAIDLAAMAIALAEHGTDGYPYASQISTGQTDLNLK